MRDGGRLPMGAQAAWGRVIGEGSAIAQWRALVTCAYQRGGRTAGRRIVSKVPRVSRDALCVPPPPFPPSSWVGDRFWVVLSSMAIL